MLLTLPPFPYRTFHSGLFINRHAALRHSWQALTSSCTLLRLNQLCLFLSPIPHPTPRPGPMSSPIAPCPGSVKFVLDFVGNRTPVEAFDASLPAHGGKNQAVMYRVKKELTEASAAAAWFEWFKSTARPATHWWWEKLNDRDDRVSILANLAHLFHTWRLPLSPFIHALCRLAAEHTQTEPLASDDAEDVEPDLEEESICADMRPHHKLAFAYWPVLRMLLPELVGKMAETQPVQLWNTPAGAASRMSPMSVMDAPQDADWMAAIRYAARAQRLHGMPHVIDSLRQTLAIATRDLEHTLVMHAFPKLRHDAGRRWDSRKHKLKLVGKLNRGRPLPDSPEQGAPAKDVEAEWQRKWQKKEEEARRRAKVESEHLRSTAGQLLDDALAADSGSLVPVWTFELPGTIGKAAKRARIDSATEPSPNRGGESTNTAPRPAVSGTAVPSRVPAAASTLAIESGVDTVTDPVELELVQASRRPAGMSVAALTTLVKTSDFAKDFFCKDALVKYKRREEEMLAKREGERTSPQGSKKRKRGSEEEIDRDW